MRDPTRSTNPIAVEGPIDALWDPPDAVPRVSKTNTENTPPEQFTYDEPGLTAIYTVEHLRNTLYDDD